MPNLMGKKKAFLKKGHRYIPASMDRSSYMAVMGSDTLKQALSLNPYKRELERKRWAQLVYLKWGFAYADYPLLIKTVASLK